MHVETFEAFQTRLQRLFQGKEYAEALTLLDQEGQNFPEYAHLIYYWRLMVTARSGQIEQANQILEEVLQSGFWFGERLLRVNEALQNLQDDPEFERLLEINRKLRQADLSKRYPLLVLRSEGRCQAGGTGCPLLLGLHANAAIARTSLDFWQPAAQAGWLVAAPESSQGLWQGAFVWDDRETAEAEIQKHISSLEEGYAVDIDRVVLAGHEKGGEVAIWTALRGKTAARGFIAIAPHGAFIKHPDRWLPLLQENEIPGLRGYLIIGEEDLNVSQNDLEPLVETFERGGVACELEVIPHVGADYSPEYDPSLLRALEFVAPE